MTDAAAEPEASDEPAEPSGPTAADGADPAAAAEPGPPATIDSPRNARPEGRPIVERIGMAAIAAVFAVLFGGVALAAFDGGEIFLAVMAAVGCLMTVWVGAITLFRG
jgi:hypothetical protein